MAVLLHVLGTSLSLPSRGGVLTSATGPTTTSFLVRFFFRRLFILALPEVLIDTVIAFGVADLVLVGTVGEEEKEKEEEKKEEIRSAVLVHGRFFPPPLFSFFLSIIFEVDHRGDLSMLVQLWLRLWLRLLSLASYISMIS